MDTTELLKKVRKIELKTRGLSNQLFSGEYHSAFKGRGMAFSEVREYAPGDDVRTIDWNVSARLSQPFVKVFEEERELTVMLMIDISGSQDFGTNSQFKNELVTELSAVISFSAIQNNDKIGLILFTDKIEKFIPPKKGKSHALRIIRELIEFTPENTKTDVGQALAYLTNVLKKKAIVFVMSDFISPNFEQALKIAGKKHDTIAVQIYDSAEEVLPEVGIIEIFDPETGKKIEIDTFSKRVRDDYSKWWENKQNTLRTMFNKNKVDTIQIRTGESYIPPLRTFFKKRESMR